MQEKNILEHPFIKNNILSYIGGKEENLSFINKKLEDIIKKTNKEIPVFVDLFSGSGIVSRLAKMKGLKVLANDFEMYSYLISRTPIRFYKEQVEDYFKFVCEKLNIKQKENSFYLTVINYLNSLEKVKYSKNIYFSKEYSPAITKNPDKKNERLYFSQENAKKLDAILEAIFNNKIFSKESREIILSSLLIETLNIINNDNKLTRSYYTEIGKGKKELKERVLKELNLKPFYFLSKEELNKMNKKLLTAEFLCEAYKKNAEIFFNKINEWESNSNLEIDIVYLDPPFQQQQYSGNYSLLNTISLNDKPEIESISVKKFIQREDNLQSNFCKKAINKRQNKKLAQIALEKTFESINAKYILYSYVPNSVLNIHEIIEIFSQNGNNHIEVDFEVEENKQDNLKNSFDYRNNVKHCLLTIQKNKRQYQHDIDFIIKELKAKSVIAENESFKINQKFINVNKLIKENEEWKKIKNSLTNKIKLFHKDKFIFEINENMMILNNIDTDFTDEDKKIIGKYIISEEKAKEISKEKEQENILSFKNSYINKDQELPNETLPNYKSIQETTKSESKKEDIEDLFKKLENAVNKNKDLGKELKKVLLDNNKTTNDKLFGLSF